MPKRRRLPEERSAFTHKFNVGPHEGYIIVGFYPDGKIGEIFLTGFGKDGSMFQSLMDCWAVTFSTAVQSGVDWETLVRKYIGIRSEPGPTSTAAIPHAESIPDYIGRWLALKYGSPALRKAAGLA